jgi:hypothetical protein
MSGGCGAKSEAQYKERYSVWFGEVQQNWTLIHRKFPEIVDNDAINEIVLTTYQAARNSVSLSPHRRLTDQSPTIKAKGFSC